MHRPPPPAAIPEPASPDRRATSASSWTATAGGLAAPSAQGGGASRGGPGHPPGHGSLQRRRVRYPHPVRLQHGELAAAAGRAGDLADEAVRGDPGVGGGRAGRQGRGAARHRRPQQAERLRLRAKVGRAEAKTAANTTAILNVAINYGGRSELVEAIRELATSGADLRELDEATLSSALYTGRSARPRPGHPHRRRAAGAATSLWQGAYATARHRNAVARLRARKTRARAPRLRVAAPTPAGRWHAHAATARPRHRLAGSDPGRRRHGGGGHLPDGRGHGSAEAGRPERTARRMNLTPRVICSVVLVALVGACSTRAASPSTC